MSLTEMTGKVLFEFDVVDSTNRHAWEWVRKHTPEGTAVQALLQEAGKGQAGNRWLSPKGENLLISFVYYPTFLPPSHVFYLSKCVSLAVHACLRAFLPPLVQLRIKWPNDLLAGFHKIAGILIENQLNHRSVSATVIGIGINVNQIRFASSLTNSATSIQQITGQTVPLEKVRATLFKEMDAYYERLRNGEYDRINMAYLEHLYGYGELVEVVHQGRPFRALHEGVDLAGRIRLRHEGQLRLFDIKEIQWILPHPPSSL